jgi:DNA mismatch repair protein MutL
MKTCRIQVLPDHLINQIAAGEVVENPASVVKELVENALDAGAGRIVVEVEGGGLAIIRVVDDGEGMTPDEARLAIARHATSKIGTVEDLDAIRTLGFRGEALPSIASVSDFELVTRRRGSDVGVRLAILDGKVTEDPAACPTGTRITVRELFRGVPARLKFQKGERARLSLVAEVVDRAALACPGVHFSLNAQGRRPFEYPPCARFVDRVTQVFGRDVAGRLQEIAAERPGVRVSGVIAEPSLARPDPSRLVLVVNGRPVQDMGIRRAVVQAHSVLVPQGRFPVAAIRIEVDPASVDVNVHPRKTEVRFRDAREVAATVFEAIQRVVAETPWVGPDPVATPGPGYFQVGGAGQWPGADSWSPTTQPDFPREPVSQGLFPETQVPKGRMSTLRYLGQVARTILVCEGPDALVLVDQHAAHERINFERLQLAMRHGNIASERLLFPEIITLDKGDIGRFDAVREQLQNLGFDVDAWSGEALAVRAIPAVLRGRSVGPVVRDCLAAASDEALASGAELVDKWIATIACHASVRAGDILSDDDARAILAGMDGVELSSYCPHGRQAVVFHPIHTILRGFGR